MEASVVIRRFKFVIAAAVLYLAAASVEPTLALRGLETSWTYIREMIEILPAVMIATGLLDVWVPRDWIVRQFGKRSGWKGRALSIGLGSVSAGPIYAAFPVTRSLLQKGADIVNVVLILSAWAVIKVPMLIVETKFLGAQFMLTRYLLTVPAILMIGAVTGWLVSEKKVLRAGARGLSERTTQILDALPLYNCGACGFTGCGECAAAIAAGEAPADHCKPGGAAVAERIGSILERTDDASD